LLPIAGEASGPVLVAGEADQLDQGGDQLDQLDQGAGQADALLPIAGDGRAGAFGFVDSAADRPRPPSETLS